MIIIGLVMLIAKKIYGNKKSFEELIHEENQMKLHLIEEDERLHGLRP